MEVEVAVSQQSASRGACTTMDVVEGGGADLGQAAAWTL